MKTTFRITAIAPTAYQHQSCARFGLAKPVGDGSFKFQQDFETEEEAKKYLIERAESYFEDREELENALDDIERYGVLNIDAATGSIEEIEL